MANSAITIGVTAAATAANTTIRTIIAIRDRAQLLDVRIAGLLQANRDQGGPAVFGNEPGRLLLRVLRDVVVGRRLTHQGGAVEDPDLALEAGDQGLVSGIVDGQG